jgi:hypothetical protein
MAHNNTVKKLLWFPDEETAENRIYQSLRWAGGAAQ